MGKSKAVRITGARSSLTEDVKGRQRKYMVSMAVRTICVILAVVLWSESRIAAIIALVGGTVIPYFAVLFANAGREGPPKTPETFVGYQPPPMLGAGSAAPTDGEGS
ncbi:DUF3099 domain-containing protein [Streptacidiphilus sp. MAP5-3]|uniref:DUF3099 domain-containing protein n=1 Tax=unclassified Streptacidiphilus TaxID=2643834 RepID=UPI003514AC3A